MRYPVGLLLTVTAVFASAACGTDEKPQPAAARSGRSLDPGLSAAASAFATAVAERNYELAYAHMSEWYKRELGHEEFLKSISRYRDGFPSAPTFTVKASDDDPAQLKDDLVMKIFVADAALRAQVQDEAIIDFRVGEDGWTIIAWLVREGEHVRILNYVQDD